MVNEVLVEQAPPESHRVSPAKYFPMPPGFMVLANLNLQYQGVHSHST
jgi:hypothetical protein